MAKSEEGQTRRGRGRVQIAAPELAPVDPTSREPAERQVYRIIRHALMQGLIPPGGTLTSRSLAQQLNVSTQPVRDALKRLEADGVLVGRPQSGFYVRDLGQSEFAELTEICVRLEGLAARRAAAFVTPDDIATLRRMNDAFSLAERLPEQLELNYQLHFLIYSRARMPQLLNMIRNMWVKIGPALHHVPITGKAEFAAILHAACIDALAARDGEAAEAMIREDITKTSQMIITLLPRHDAPSSGLAGKPDETEPLFD
ncbi:MAG: GntR family transcriptional regulator [Pseudooceanicola atlanticus]